MILIDFYYAKKEEEIIDNEKWFQSWDISWLIVTVSHHESQLEGDSRYI